MVTCWSQLAQLCLFVLGFTTAMYHWSFVISLDLPSLLRIATGFIVLHVAPPGLAIFMRTLLAARQSRATSPLEKAVESNYTRGAATVIHFWLCLPRSEQLAVVDMFEKPGFQESQQLLGHANGNRILIDKELIDNSNLNGAKMFKKLPRENTL